MKNLHLLIFFFFIFVLGSCQKEIETKIETEVETITEEIKPVVQSIHFEQKNVYYLSAFDITKLSFHVGFDDESERDVNMSVSMFSISDQEKIQTAGLHQLSLEYQRYKKTIVIYIVDLDPSIELTAIYFEKPKEKIPRNELDFSAITICFEFELVITEKFQLFEAMIEKNSIKEFYFVGNYTFIVKMFGQSLRFNVDLTHANVVYVDDRTLYTGEISEDVIRKIEVLRLQNSRFHQVLSRVILVTHEGFILYDGTDHLYMKYDNPSSLKVNDEVLVDVEVVYRNSRFEYKVIELKLIERYMPYIVEPAIFELKEYLTVVKDKEKELKYQFRGIFTYINQKLVFTDGEYEIKDMIYDDETLLVINQYIHQLVDVNFYLAKTNGPRKFILDINEMKIVQLSAIHKVYYTEFFLNLEIKHILNDLPTIITKSDRLTLVNKGIFGSVITWIVKDPKIISKEGIVQSGVNKYTCTVLMMNADDGKTNKGSSIDLCITVGVPMTLKQADIISLNTDYEVIVKGLILKSSYGVSLIYDGTSYAFVKYDGKIGDVIEVHGFYEKYEEYLGGLSYPYIVKPSNNTYTKPVAISDFDFINNSLNETMFGKTFDVELNLVSISNYLGWDAFNPMGGLPYLTKASTFTISGTTTKVHLIDDQNTNLSGFVDGSKVKFIFVGLNSFNELEGILVEINE
ncbi:MAG: hypothetical protein Q7I99_02020 [Acholeplasmataceae bacterium]|nr:hypothetical protein [Acholeplasmataceae bacterium]